MANSEKLNYTSRSTWNEFQIFAPDGRLSEGIYINMSRLDEKSLKEMRKRLVSLGIRASRQLVKVETDQAKEGESILSITHPADVEKLSLLFDDASPSKKDWRNLKNWDYREFTYKGKMIPSYGFCVQNVTMAGLEKIGNVLSDLGISFDLAAADIATRHIRLGEIYLRVVGAESVKKLKEFTKPWTQSTSRPRRERSGR